MLLAAGAADYPSPAVPLLVRDYVHPALLRTVQRRPALGRALSRDFDRPVADLPKILVSTLEHTNGQELGQRLAEALGVLG